jgi:hypothetical protein
MVLCWEADKRIKQSMSGTTREDRIRNKYVKGRSVNSGQNEKK